MCNFSFIFYSVVEVGFHKSSQGLGVLIVCLAVINCYLSSKKLWE